MSTDVAKTNENPMDAFKEKLSEKIRQDIGALLPDEAVSALVARAIEDEFFTKQVVKKSQWGHPEVLGPSLFVEEVIKAAQPILEDAVKQYVETNKKLIEQHVKDFLNDQNLTILAVAQMASILQLTFNKELGPIVHRLGEISQAVHR